jgi:DNA-binding beta-propeller fold protein YncE
VSGDTYAIVKTIKLAKEADSMAYDALRKRIYVANGGKEAEMDYSQISIISTENNSHLNDIKIDSGNIEAMAIAAKRPQLFVNIRDKGRVGIVDLTKNSLVNSWALPVSGNTPIRLDEQDRRLYLVGRKPGKFVVLDSDTGKVIATVDCVEGADEMSYDAQHNRFYITGAEGFITVIEKRNANEYEAVAKISTGYRGKNSIYVPELGRFYVAVSEHEGKTAELRVYQVD